MALPETLTFVTGNAGKLAEARAALAPLGIDVVGDARGYPEIQADDLAAVASQGAHHLLDAGMEPPFILEDAGLFIAALKGFPGVYSRHAYDTIGCSGVLRLMQDVELESRTAAFRAHLQYVDPDTQHHGFAGTCRGRIADRATGSNGFGFDPIFIPDGHTQTFGQMDDLQKTSLSHRGAAMRAFLDHLSNQ